MSYQVFARKWRPQTFEEVVNQDHVKTTLANAIKLDRIAHSYIFAGPRGVGKTTIARILARALNCEMGPTVTPCNECTPCVEIIEDRSLDVMEIDGASNRGIEDIRNIRENVKYSPVHGKYRIYIIDEVHMLTREAFNALLKTLEEPPGHVLFIFATTEFQKIPATILSRCQRFEFKRLPVTELVKQLQKICESEKVAMDEDALMLVAKRADGSMRDGVSLLDQLVAYCGSDISIDNIVSVLGLIRDEVYLRCSEAIIHNNVAEGFAIAKEIYDSGYDPGEFLNGLIEHFRNILVTKISENADAIDATEEVKKIYLDTSAKFSEMDVLRVINAISDAENQIKRSAQPLLRLELLLAKLISMDSSVTAQQIFDALGGEFPEGRSNLDTNIKNETPAPVVKEKTQSYKKEETASDDIPNRAELSGESAIKDSAEKVVQPDPPDIAPEDIPGEAEILSESADSVSVERAEQPKAQSSAQDDVRDNVEFSGEGTGNGSTAKAENHEISAFVAEDIPDEHGSALTLDGIKSGWSVFTETFQKEHALTGMLVVDAKPTGFADDKVELTFSQGNSFNIENLERHKDKVLKVLKKVYHQSIGFTCVVSEEPVEENAKVVKNDFVDKERAAVQKIIEKEPIIQSIIDTFGCSEPKLRPE